MIIYGVYLSWLALAALPVVVAQGSVANCTDIVNFRWVGASVVFVVSILSITCRYSTRGVRVLVKSFRIYQLRANPTVRHLPNSCIDWWYELTAIGSGFTLQPLTSGSYPGPSVGQTNNCHCSSIFYSLISACGACQDGNWITYVRFVAISLKLILFIRWQQYLKNCTGPIFLTV